MPVCLRRLTASIGLPVELAAKRRAALRRRERESRLVLAACDLGAVDLGVWGLGYDDGECERVGRRVRNPDHVRSSNLEGVPAIRELRCGLRRTADRVRIRVDLALEAGPELGDEGKGRGR